MIITIDMDMLNVSPFKEKLPFSTLIPFSFVVSYETLSRLLFLLTNNVNSQYSLNMNSLSCVTKFSCAIISLAKFSCWIWLLGLHIHNTTGLEGHLSYDVAISYSYGL